jgi:hypothetical protein
MENIMTTPEDIAKTSLAYDNETGGFVWTQKISRKNIVGATAGTLRPDGYITIQVAKKRFMAHRLAWFFVHGEWPKEIDHKNRNRSDNRIANLRSVTSGQNKQNILVARAHNKNSGLLGVYLDKRKIRNPWRASIVVDDRPIHLGVFPTKEAAHAAYLHAKKNLHPFSELAAA